MHGLLLDVSLLQLMSFTIQACRHQINMRLTVIGFMQRTVAAHPSVSNTKHLIASLMEHKSYD